MTIDFLRTDFEKISYLLNILIERATGTVSESSEYEAIRRQLLEDQKIAPKLPVWLRTHRSLDSFWRFIKNKSPKYNARQDFLNQEFAPILNELEFENIPIVQGTTDFKESHIEMISARNKRKIFIVHGKNNEVKQEISRFIESQGIDVIILHEQASGGRTIIEKIEYYSNEADFALILYTACDQGRSSDESRAEFKNRARQNVVFEHGYLMAKLGRKNVCALVQGEIETPNDISGVVYIPLDQAGGWKSEVIKELKTCGYKIPS